MKSLTRWRTRLIVLFFVTGCIGAMAQEHLITINLENKTLRELFSEIEKQTTYRFAYRNVVLDNKKDITIHMRNTTIPAVLTTALSGRNLDFNIVSATSIVISDKRQNQLNSNEDRKISGTIATQDGEPIIGATVSVKGGSIGTMTDVDGQFSLNIPSNAVLTVSYVGYKTQEINIDGRTDFRITLQEDEKLLEEVVVIGYGAQRKKDLTGAVSVIDSKELSTTPSNDFGAALKGRAAGVQVITPSGKPNAGFVIRVRGASSINAGNEPLYVVDGIPTTDTKSINPNEIESISILKDASSAAIYGASGANGVVLITTKKGDKENARVELNAYWGVSRNVENLKVLDADQYADLMSDLGYSLDRTRYNANTDWQKEIYQDAPVQNYQVSFSGGNQKGNYYTSLGYVNQDGIVRSSKFERYNFKLNLENEIKPWLRVGSNVNYSRIDDVDVGDGNSESAILAALNTPPVIGIYNEDGTFTGNPFQSGWENPLSYTDGESRKWESTRILGNLFTEITFAEPLKLKNSIALENANDQYDSFIDPFRSNWGRANRGIARQDKGGYTKWISENLLTYNQILNDSHSVQSLLGLIVSKDRYQSSNISTKGFSNDKFPSFAAGTVLENKSESITENTNVSYLGRVNYSFQSKYLLTANLRADGSSKFGANHRWGYFPSFSLGWRISSENFMENYTFLDDLKIRTGWGVTGNDQIGSYNAFAVYGIGANYPFNDVIQSGYYQQNLGNDKLKWETTSQTNFGIDAVIFNSRLTVTADLYYKKTSDLLLYVQLPLTTGFSSGLQNIGNVENKGFEILVSSRNLTGALQWDTDLNVSINRNKVLSLGNTPMIFSGSLDEKIKGDVSVVTEGEPLGSFYGYKAVGVNPDTGDLMYENAEGVYVYGRDLDPDKDRRIIGCAQPDFMYGINNTLRYKGFELSVFLQGAYGSEVYNATKMFMEGMFDSRNQSMEVADRWKTKGQYTDIPRAVQANYDNTQISTRFVEDGSYLKIKNIRLSYTLPSKLTKKILIDRCNIYGTVDNVYTFTKYSGYDPELSKDGASSTSIGIDQGTYPYARTFIVGLNLVF